MMFRFRVDGWHGTDDRHTDGRTDVVHNAASYRQLRDGLHYILWPLD